MLKRVPYLTGVANTSTAEMYTVGDRRNTETCLNLIPGVTANTRVVKALLAVSDLAVPGTHRHTLCRGDNCTRLPNLLQNVPRAASRTDSHIAVPHTVHRQRCARVRIQAVAIGTADAVVPTTVNAVPATLSTAKCRKENHHNDTRECQAHREGAHSKVTSKKSSEADAKGPESQLRKPR